MNELQNNNKGRTPCEIFSRVVGYLRPIDTWNEGKVSEFHDRKMFKVNQNGEDKRLKE